MSITHRALAALFLMLALVACGGSPPAATVPTEAPTIVPTPEPTVPPASPTPEPPPAEPVPLTVEGLSSILIQEGDLPEGWSGDDLFEESPVDYEGPAPLVVLNQELLEPDARFASGRVTLWVFENGADAEAAFTSRSDLIQRTVDADADRQQPAIGEQALLVPGHGSVFVTNQVVFRRCNAVVEISLGNSSQVDWATNYATRLDQRLQPSVCP